MVAQEWMCTNMGLVHMTPEVVFPADIVGQSMCTGGATSLAEAAVALPVIQAIGQWASTTFQIYIRKNPVLLQALLFGCPVHQNAIWLSFIILSRYYLFPTTDFQM
jgi:hypothetical protein